MAEATAAAAAVVVDGWLVVCVGCLINWLVCGVVARLVGC